MNAFRNRPLLTMILLLASIRTSASPASEFNLQQPVAKEDLEFVRSFLQSKMVGPGQSFDTYFQHYEPPFDRFAPWQVAWARQDLNGDGKTEVVIQFQHAGVCGSGGCSSFILRNVKRKWVEIGEFYGGETIEKTDPVIDGWPRLFSHEACLVWNGVRYDWFNDDPMEMGVDPECRR